MHVGSRGRCVEFGRIGEAIYITHRVVQRRVDYTYNQRTYSDLLMPQTQDGKVISSPGVQNSEVRVTCPADQTALVCIATVTEDGTYYMHGEWRVATLECE